MTDVRIGMSKSKELHVFYMYDKAHFFAGNVNMICLLYTSDAADD